MKSTKSSGTGTQDNQVRAFIFGHLNKFLSGLALFLNNLMWYLQDCSLTLDEQNYIRTDRNLKFVIPKNHLGFSLSTYLISFEDVAYS